jgi:hypothetical protein
MADPAETVLTPLDAIACDFGGGAVLRLKTRGALEMDQRRDFIARAVELGHRQSDIARYLDRTRSAVSQLLREC